ncbi:Solute carrier family 22 member 23 [Amphibalanus amphitrite]|uniref:Solute carrier family 22 member 23 n=1 Tax=Amphibalanus amphitrite TaxID=1232801 RepID=A0A6A4V3Y3_AMPAM|nr:Solute carrier family 22 member 23 [Amphibalanus amphitrite]
MCIVTNNWVCEDAWRPFVIHAVFWVGNIFGSWVWGTISDKLGRRPATLASFVLYSVFGAMTLLQPSSMAALATIRFLVGTAHHTISHLPYMLGKSPTCPTCLTSRSGESHRQWQQRDIGAHLKHLAQRHPHAEQQAGRPETEQR